jgi:hypothetical protein
MAFEHARCTKFWGDDCGADHYLVVAKVRERLAISERVGQKFDG